MALGADWCMAARPFMFALGCLQSQKCHDNTCPVGIATQDPGRARGLVVPEKANRVKNYHAGSIKSLADLASATRLGAPHEFRLHHFSRRLSDLSAITLDQFYPQMVPGSLLDESAPDDWQSACSHSSAENFA
ncbi:MAG: glutamate synthase domain-containing protein 2 [Limisphaerales bacterium]|jgi:glutamate synthase domain-containing protein 2